jgi:hypothetical protein
VTDLGPNQIVEKQLHEQLELIENELQADVLCFVGPLDYGIEDEIKDAIEDITPRKDRLAVIVDTPGGYIVVAERIAHTFRHHYGRVEFIVPGSAMSAGTVLVMSGDAIHMDYSSVLGPIDPQVARPGSGFIPALGYLEKFNDFIERSKKGELTTAELMYLVQNFDPAEMYQYEQERELSIALLKEWLVNYKFKSWVKKKSSGVAVTPRMRTMRARKIAVELNKTGRWHSHSRGIHMDVLRSDLKLEIEDFGMQTILGPAIRKYHRLLIGYMALRGHNDIVLHRRGTYVGR